MAKARPIPGIGEDDAFAAVASRVVEVRWREVADAADGVLDLEDIERLHAMRVATRRLRAALEVFEPCFPRKRYRRALGEVKELADALGERRDRDVTLEALDRFAEELGPADRPGVNSFAAALRREQADANRSVAPHVRAERIAELGERLTDLVGAAAARAPASAAPSTNGGDPL
jgi:CHAD domain-containing protein